MKVRITDPAKLDLVRIRAYLRNQSLSGASRVGRELRDACLSLRDFPDRSRVGLVPGTRENVSVWPYIIVYRITDTEVQILRVWHSAQDRL